MKRSRQHSSFPDKKKVSCQVEETNRCLNMWIQRTVTSLCLVSRTCLSRVVLPDPRKPQSKVTGTSPSSLAAAVYGNRFVSLEMELSTPYLIVSTETHVEVKLDISLDMPWVQSRLPGAGDTWTLSKSPPESEPTVDKLLMRKIPKWSLCSCARQDRLLVIPQWFQNHWHFSRKEPEIRIWIGSTIFGVRIYICRFVQVDFPRAPTRIRSPNFELT